MKKSIPDLSYALGHPSFTLLLVFVCLFSFQVKAQNNIKSEEIDIVKPYQPLLADAQKINLEAVPASADTTMTPLTYDVKTHLIAVPFVPSDIRAIAMPATPPQPLQNNMLRFGFGTQFTLPIDLYLNSARSDKYNAGFEFHHLSSDGKLDFQNFNTNNASLFGTSYFGSTALSGKLSYDNELYHFYGFDHSDTAVDFKKDFLKQRYQNFGVNLGFKNTKDNKQLIDYGFNFDFHYMQKNPSPDFLTSANENYFRFAFDVHKKIQTIHSANVTFDFEKEKFRSSADTDLNYFSVIPYYQYDDKKMKITAGVNLTVLNSTFAAFPYLEGQYKLIGEYLIPYVGWEGERRLNTIQSLSAINPFIGNFSADATKMSGPYLGLKGSYGNNLSYNIKGSYQTLRNDPFFLPDSIPSPTTFKVLYYYRANVITFHAEVAYRESEHINLILSGDASSYDLDFNDQPWGIPKSQISLAMEYNIQQKIFVNLNLFAHTGAYTIVPATLDTLQLKGRFDANLSLNYNYKRNIGFWLVFNNITASSASEWYNYPTYKFQALVGVNLKF